MSRTRVYKQATLDIQRRFFDTVQELVKAKKLPGGIAGYCNIGGLDSRHFYAQKNNNGRGYFEVAWILPLIERFNVSSDWLLLGTGEKYREMPKTNHTL